MTPEQIKCIDPCCGSGHILAYLFDVLVQIYESYGYTTREAVTSIVQNNLYGLDIDDRAAQLAYFAVMMKARQYDRRFFSRQIQPNVYAIQESNGIDRYALEYFFNGDAKLEAAMDSIITEMHDAKEYGSILNITPVDFSALYARFDEVRDDIHISREVVLNSLLPLVQMAEALAQKYDVVVTNPPYMGISNADNAVAEYVKKNFSDNKIDLFSVFMCKAIDMLIPTGYCSLITQQTWMFISSFKKTREMLQRYKLTSLNHLGARAFEEISGEVVQSTAYCLQKIHTSKYNATFVKLDDVAEKQSEFFNNSKRYIRDISTFSELPDAIFAYWLAPNVVDSFGVYPEVSKMADGKIGLQTGDNDRFLRLWHEIEQDKFAINGSSVDKYWIPYNKAGSFRRWYGNHEYVVNWKNDGFDIINCRDDKGRLKSRPQNKDFYFKSGITWSDVCTGLFSMRMMPSNYIFDSCAPTIFSSAENMIYLLALYNSKVAQLYLNFLAPTIHYTCGSVLKLPCIKTAAVDCAAVKLLTELAKQDWDSFETSWDFAKQPLIRSVSTLADAFTQWETECNDRFNQLKDNEEELNRIFIDTYGLQDELTPEVEDKDVTVRKADLTRDIKSLISYAVGCMFGRYSLDRNGLVYAGGAFEDFYQRDSLATENGDVLILGDISLGVSESYTQVKVGDQWVDCRFPVDKDNIIPIYDDPDYSENDLPNQFVMWIKTVYGKDTLDENLKFIADALGGKGQPREVIRNYFLNDFYADHCKIYQKRPIYWLFDSGKKNGFKALIYMHRYQPDTIARIRTDYVQEQQSRYRTAIADLENRIANASTSERVKLNKALMKLKDQDTELRTYEEKIHHLADQMIAIDLDDGVKVNYAKFQDVLAKIK